MVSVRVAAALASGFGAAWYGLLGRPWMAATGLTEAQVRERRVLPFAARCLCLVRVAGMTRHILGAGGIHGFGAGAVTGLGLGLFVVAPWIATNVLFANRSPALIWIDGGYAAIGTALIGLVLVLF